MKHANTRALYDYWNSLREGRLAPFRSEVDPREIAPLLDSTFILEILSPENIRFRLAGTRLCENFGMELRGMSALALWHGDCRNKVRDVMRRVVADPCIGHVACTVENRGGFVYSAEFLYMPLRSDMGDMTRILGCGYYMGEREAFANLYDPIHHWVDAINLYDIHPDADLDDLDIRRMFRRDGPPKGSRANARPTVLRGLPTPAPNPVPTFQAIDGGLKNGASGAGRNGRSHLRIVKTDAG